MAVGRTDCFSRVRAMQLWYGRSGAVQPWWARLQGSPLALLLAKRSFGGGRAIAGRCRGRRGAGWVRSPSCQRLTADGSGLHTMITGLWYNRSCWMLLLLLLLLSPSSALHPAHCFGAWFRGNHLHPAKAYDRTLSIFTCRSRKP